MRLMLKIKPKENFVYEEVNKYFIHSFIWNLLRDTEFSKFHDVKKFKMFTFSNIFPVNEFRSNEEKKFIISSPNTHFIDTITEKLENIRHFNLGIHEFELTEFNKFSMELKPFWQTSTPIVLYEDNTNNTYFSIKRNPDLNFFVERIKDNALKKYNAFYNKNFTFEEPIFERLFFKKQVAVNLRKNQKEFVIIGTIWEFEINLIRLKNNNLLNKFYNFIMDCGLGEKNSFGFGFVNMIQERQNIQKNKKPLITYEYD